MKCIKFKVLLLFSIILASCNNYTNTEQIISTTTYSVSKQGDDFSVHNIADGEEIFEGINFEIAIGHVQMLKGQDWQGTMEVSIDSNNLLDSTNLGVSRLLQCGDGKHYYRGKWYKVGEHDVKDSFGNIWVCEWTVFVWMCNCRNYSGHSSTSHSYCD